MKESKFKKYGNYRNEQSPEYMTTSKDSYINHHIVSNDSLSPLKGDYSVNKNYKYMAGNGTRDLSPTFAETV
jgi:hypothetical protein